MSRSSSGQFYEDKGPYLDADEYFNPGDGRDRETDELNWQAHQGPKLKASFSLLGASALAQLKATGNFRDCLDDVTATKRLDVPVGLPLKTVLAKLAKEFRVHERTDLDVCTLCDG